ncbi:MAG: L-2-amino-thiazoline-4-carboxylic acid hydrolase [Candidatus Thorarchaeota archaeon]|nr:MAG: L-2-amino-thiazoline-4-carboxylic acid hydrolase [Candidatus Thorarchaeota archaeon]
MEDTEDYYIRNKVRFAKEFEKILSVAKKVTHTRFDERTLEILIERSRKQFEHILSEIPYVGGDRSPATELMMHGAQTIAFYKACKSIGMESREFGQLMYEIAEAYMESASWIRRRIVRRLAFSNRAKLQWKTWATESQNREYSQNWIGEFIDGDGTVFDWGLNFEECGWLKLAREHGVEEIAPFACLADFARMRAFGVGFRRTQTLALGHPRCDFRFGKNLETPRGWPPEGLEEFKGVSSTDFRSPHSEEAT